MKRILFLSCSQVALLLLCAGGLLSCASPVKLTRSWAQPEIPAGRLSNILVVSFARDAGRQKLGEDHLKAELRRHGFTAVTSLEVFGPEFANADSLKRWRLLLSRHFDGMLTIRVLKVEENEHWEKGSVLLQQPGYSVSLVDVVLESDLYQVDKGTLLWWGRSDSFTNDPTDEMASQYARNIVGDLLRKKVLRN